MKNNNILIIDDDARNIFALKATLASLGFSCLTALSAQEGLQMLMSLANIKIVLMDMMMPEMDGYEALKLIRSQQEFREVVVIAVTAQAMVGDRERCLQAGANDYISKPIDVDNMLSIIKKY